MSADDFKVLEDFFLARGLSSNDSKVLADMLDKAAPQLAAAAWTIAWTGSHVHMESQWLGNEGESRCSCCHSTSDSHDGLIHRRDCALNNLHVRLNPNEHKRQVEVAHEAALKEQEFRDAALTYAGTLNLHNPDTHQPRLMGLSEQIAQSDTATADPIADMAVAMSVLGVNVTTSPLIPRGVAYAFDPSDFPPPPTLARVGQSDLEGLAAREAGVTPLDKEE